MNKFRQNLTEVSAYHMIVWRGIVISHFYFIYLFFCLEQNSTTILLKLHKMIKDIERKCSVQEPSLYLAYFFFKNYFPLLNFLVWGITPKLRGQVNK